MRAPARIDFGGGWTDVPPYCDNEGGFVCNVAIDLCSTAKVTSAVAPSVSDDPLIAAAMQYSGVGDATITLSSDFPIGSGLGGSAAASAAVLGGLRVWRGLPIDLVALAEAGRAMEVEHMGIAGGRQDHYASTHGGVLALEFSSEVVAKRIEMLPETVAELERRAILIYTGESRISGDTITAVLDSYLAREKPVLDALENMKGLAVRMAEALNSGDIGLLGEAVAEHWRWQRSLHTAIPTEKIDEIIARATSAGAVGCKALGASGGGTVLLIAGEDNADAIRESVRGLGEELSFGVDLDGVREVVD